MAAAYRRKLAELSRLGVDVVAVVPPEWKEAGGVQALEPGQDDGYDLVVSPVRWNGHFHLHFYPQLGAILRRLRPDLLHLDEEPYNLATYLGMRSARSLDIPTVFFTWQNINRRYPPPFRQMERAVFRGADAALAGSHEAAEVLRAKSYRGPVHVIPQFGVDPHQFSPGSDGHAHFTVGFLNRLIPAKEPLLALRAFADLPADSRLVIAGDGPLRPDVEREIESLGLAGRVSLRTRVPSSDMPELIRSLDVVILPSRTTPGWKEQFGRVLIEAMACGLPVVGSDSGEIPHVVGGGGLIVPEGDAGALAAALLRLRDDPDLRRELGVRGRARVLQEFTHEVIARKTVAAYEEAIGSR